MTKALPKTKEPIIWLLPLFWVILQKEKNNLASLGITFKNFFPSIYLSLGLGAVFVMEAVLIHFFKYGSLNLSSTISSSGKPLLFALGLSFLTAVSEELAFRGYIFSRLANTLKSELVANTLSSGLWTIIHIPIAIFVLKLDVWSAFIYLALVMIFGVGASFVFARTKNIFSAIFLHVLWQWPLILFK